MCICVWEYSFWKIEQRYNEKQNYQDKTFFILGTCPDSSLYFVLLVEVSKILICTINCSINTIRSHFNYTFKIAKLHKQYLFQLFMIGLSFKVICRYSGGGAL